MLFEITHVAYVCSQPVTLGPHGRRLRPRVDGCQRLLDCQLRLGPEPALRSDCLDVEGAAVTQVGFEGTTLRLSIVSAFVLETLRADPFDYRLEPGWGHNGNSSRRFGFLEKQRDAVFTLP